MRSLSPMGHPLCRAFMAMATLTLFACGSDGGGGTGGGRGGAGGTGGSTTGGGGGTGATGGHGGSGPTGGSSGQRGSGVLTTIRTPLIRLCLPAMGRLATR
jgi:hypothetical protein